MKTPVFFLIFLLAYGSYGQSRIYLSGGITNSTGGSSTTVFAETPTLPCMDLEWEKKIVGAMSLVTGVSYFGTGYSNSNTLFGNQSVFKATYVGVPVMARWNQFNKHNLYLDFGLMTSYLASAHLQESSTKFGVLRTAEGDISAYSNRILLLAKFQENIVINRFTFVIFLQVPFKGQSMIKDLPDHWPFNQQQSTYLLSNGYTDYLMFGIKVGVRLK